jgi:hypothetical protein
VLDYGIVIVAVQSESSPFQHWSTEESKRKEEGDSDEDSLDEVDRNAAEKKEEQRKNQAKSKWIHRGGDILAAVHAVGAFTYAGRDAGGAAEKAACRRFCEDNGLHPVVLERIQKMRIHLARLAKIRLSNAKGIAAKTGGILSTMPPPNKQQENLLLQVSAILDVGDVHASVTVFSYYLVTPTRQSHQGCLITWQGLPRLDPSQATIRIASELHTLVVQQQ